MIRFCDSGKDYENLIMAAMWDGCHNGYYLHGHLKYVAGGIDYYCHSQGHQFTDITDIFREFYEITKKRKGTFHWIGQALDFRTKYWPKKTREGVELTLQAFKKTWSQLQWVWEKDHLHVEIDDGNAIVKGKQKRTVH